MTIRTTFEIDHDKLESLVDDNGVLADLLYNAAAGDPDSADELRRMFGIRIVAQVRHITPANRAQEETAQCK